MSFLKSTRQKVLLSIIIGVLIIALGIFGYLWQTGKLKFSASTIATPKVFNYVMSTTDTSKYDAASTLVTDSGYIKLNVTASPSSVKTISTTVSGIQNQSELSEWILVTSGATTPLKTAPVANVISTLNRTPNSFDNNNNITASKSFTHPIVLTLTPQTLPVGAVISNINVYALKNNSGLSGNDLNMILSSDYNVARNFTVSPQGCAGTNTVCNIDFNKNYKAGAQSPWTAADLNTLYLSIIPTTVSSSSISMIQVTITYTNPFSAVTTGLIAPTNANFSDSGNTLTAWQTVKVDKLLIPMLPSSASASAQIQWFAGTQANIAADLASVKLTNSLLTTCKSSCSSAITIGSTAALNLTNSPVGQYGAYAIKFYVSSLLPTSLQVGQNLTVSAAVPAPVAICPVNLTVNPTSLGVNESITITGTNFKTSGVAYSVYMMKSDGSSTTKINLSSVIVSSTMSMIAVIPPNVSIGNYYIYVQDPTCSATKSSNVLNIHDSCNLDATFQSSLNAALQPVIASVLPAGISLGDLNLGTALRDSQTKMSNTPVVLTPAEIVKLKNKTFTSDDVKNVSLRFFNTGTQPMQVYFAGQVEKQFLDIGQNMNSKQWYKLYQYYNDYTTYKSFYDSVNKQRILTTPAYTVTANLGGLSGATIQAVNNSYTLTVNPNLSATYACHAITGSINWSIRGNLNTKAQAVNISYGGVTYKAFSISYDAGVSKSNPTINLQYISPL